MPLDPELPPSPLLVFELLLLSNSSMALPFLRQKAAYSDCSGRCESHTNSRSGNDGWT